MLLSMSYVNLAYATNCTHMQFTAYGIHYTAYIKNIYAVNYRIVRKVYVYLYNNNKY